MKRGRFVAVSLLLICLAVEQAIVDGFAILKSQAVQSRLKMYPDDKDRKLELLKKQRTSPENNRFNKFEKKQTPEQMKRNKLEQQKPRSLVTNYKKNRSPKVNEKRMVDSVGCEHFDHCSGCLIDTAVAEVDSIESAKIFFSSSAVRKRRMDVPRGDIVVETSDDGFFDVIVPSKVTGWRTQAKLAAAPKTSSWARDGCKFGLYKRRSHTVLPIPNCQVHHPAINRAVRALEEATENVKTTAYEETTMEGGLRYIQIQVERISEKVSLTLVWKAETLKETQPQLARLVKELRRVEPDLWQSIWCNCNDSLRNNIFNRKPNRWHRLYGSSFLREPIPTGDRGWLYFNPLTFRQGNMDGFDVLAQDVATCVPPGSRVCELYAGVGYLGFTALCRHSAGSKPLTWVRMSDENPANLHSFQKTMDSLPMSVKAYRSTVNPPKKKENVSLSDFMRQMESGKESEREGNRASYKVMKASEALMDGQALGADVLIVDPPRRGLEPEVLVELCKPFNPQQNYAETKDSVMLEDEEINWANDVTTFIYVSCGFDALAEDTDMLLNSQAGWKLEKATGYMLFPGSDHVETIAVFKRRV